MWYYRGFIPKGDRVLGHNIIVAPNLRYGLKRRSGTFGFMSDLNEGLVHRHYHTVTIQI